MPAQIPRLAEPELAEGFVRRRISVIVPAYNEADHIAESLLDIKNQFERISRNYEIIVIDDGSTDGTTSAAYRVVDDTIRVVAYENNQGKGYALRVGIRKATGQFTFLVDSDSEIQAKDLADYLKALESADIVIGSKRHPHSVVQTPVVRRFLSLGYNVLERLLTGVKATDTQAGFKAARSATLYRVLPLLSVKKYAFDAELLAVASLLRLRIRELPVRIELRATFSVRQVFRMLIDLLGIAYRLRVRRWYQENMVKMSETYKPMIPW